MNADERRSDRRADGGERVAGAAACERFAHLGRMTREMLSRMTPAERDRMMQEHLAAARGPERNLQLLCDTVHALLAMRGQSRSEGTKGDGDGK